MSSSRAGGGRWLVVGAVLIVTAFMLEGCGGGLQAGAPTIDFTVSASPGAQAIKAGTGAQVKVAISPAAMIGAVNLSTSGLPEGVTANFGVDVDVLNGAKTLYISSTQTATAGTFQVAVIASDSMGQVRNTSFHLTIAPAADFSMSVAPAEQTVKPGQSTSFTVDVLYGPGTAGPVNLSTGPLPSGASVTFAPSTLAASGTSLATITTAQDAATSSSSVNIEGTDSSGTLVNPVTLTISPADFQLLFWSGPSVVNAGGTYPAQINVASLFGQMPGTVTLTASGVPAGVGIAFSPSSIAGSGVSNLTIATDTSTLPGNYTLTVSGTDASGTNMTIFPLTVVAGTPNVDTFLGVTTNAETINVGQDAYFGVYVSGRNGTASPANISVSVDKSDVQASLIPSTTQTGLYTLTLATEYPQTVSTQAAATITATDASGIQTMSVQVTITQVAPPCTDLACP